MFRCRRSATLSAALVMAFALPAALAAAGAQPEPPALLRIPVIHSPSEVGLPVHAVLQDAAGGEYVLAVAPAAAGAAYGAQVLDPDATNATYVIALERRPGARALAAVAMPVLLDDGRRVVVRDAPGRRERLAAMGFDLGLFSPQPLDLTAARAPAVPSITFDPRIQAMIDSVTQTAVFDSDGNLSGENEVTIGTEPYTIVTRHTGSGTPIQMATQYVYELLEQLGLDVSYDSWTSGGYTGRNVVGERLGADNPDEIVLVTGHLDDMPSGGVAPGADDNASGSVGVLLAAQAMSSEWFRRTVRFVLFTGEEQGLLGSQAYAAELQAAGENVVAVVNMDMIAWDAVDGPTLRIHTRTTGNPGYPADSIIATTFTDVVSVYGLSGSLSPILDPDGITASDHASFWSRGYPAVLAIEDDVNDFNAYYHTVNDKRQYLNLPYMTAFIKASVGTAAHLAVPSIAPCQQNIAPIGVATDAHSSPTTVSNLNGIVEMGETVMLTPTWQYPGGCLGRQVTGTLTEFTGPTGLNLFIPDDGASYGTMTAGEQVDCYEGSGNCYVVKVSPIGQRPAGHVDLQATEHLSANRDQVWTIHLGGSFSDVPTTHWAYVNIESLFHSGITSGCHDDQFCPASNVTRAQMAKFLLKGKWGGEFTPSGCTEPPFDDVPCSTWFADWVVELADEGITVGCGNGDYCPYSSVTRAQMAIFLLRSLEGGDYTPPPCVTPSFSDVECGTWYGAWVEELARRGITEGCGSGAFCPFDPVTRAQMATFLLRTFAIPAPPGVGG